MNPTPTVPLAQLLRTLASELQAESPPPLRARLPAAPAANVKPSPAPRRPWLVFTPLRTVWAGAAACVLVLIVSAWLMSLVRPGPDTRELARASGFLPIRPLEQWGRPDGPDGMPDAAWLVSTEMPNERLAALGLPYDPARAGETVRAELLMRASGEVLAVRFVR